MLYLKEVKQLLKRITWSPFLATLEFMLISIIIVCFLGCLAYFIIQGQIEIQDVKFV